eukprot:5448815-Amphidinium_carterae.2
MSRCKQTSGTRRLNKPKGDGQVDVMERFTNPNGQHESQGMEQCSEARDGQTWMVAFTVPAASSGHIIQRKPSFRLPQRSRLCPDQSIEPVPERSS